MSYRDKIEGNELDLSLNQLTEVPVKELAAATKATCLDLSCNLIQSLPPDFSTLTHLVKIDLSQNRLSELPAKFGNLLNLQHLDLYANNIVSLPVSFCRLKNLRWLDLKNNPLEPKLKNVAGDCLDEKACHTCAKKVVAYMQSIESELEREKQKRLKAVREKEAIEREKMERELEEQRRLKKFEKEKRKAESKAKREAELLEYDLQNDFKNLNISNDKVRGDGEQVKMFGAKSSGCLQLFYFCGLAAFLIFGISYGIQKEIISAAGVKFSINNILVNLKASLIEISKLIIFYIPKVREEFLKLIFQYMETLSYFSSEIEKFVANYV